MEHPILAVLLRSPLADAGREPSVIEERDDLFGRDESRVESDGQRCSVVKGMDIYSKPLFPLLRRWFHGGLMTAASAFGSTG